MPLVVHERVGLDGRGISPFSWRLRYALAHKGLAPEFIPTRFADVDRIRALSGQHFVPIIEHDGRVVHDTWTIAVYLDEQFSHAPSLLGDATGWGLTRWTNIWSTTVLAPVMRRLISADFIWCIDPGDRAYFRSSREAAFGCSLEEYCAHRPRWLAALAEVCTPLETTLAEQPFLCGAAPAYADYLVFSLFQWARIGSPQDVLTPGTKLQIWRDSLVAMFDGLGEKLGAYPNVRSGPDRR